MKLKIHLPLENQVYQSPIQIRGSMYVVVVHNMDAYLYYIEPEYRDADDETVFRSVKNRHPERVWRVYTPDRDMVTKNILYIKSLLCEYIELKALKLEKLSNSRRGDINYSEMSYQEDMALVQSMLEELNMLKGDNEEYFYGEVY